jgi:hypothetical protein
MPLEGPRDFASSQAESVARDADLLVHLVEGDYIGWPSHRHEYNDQAAQGEEIEPHVRGIQQVVWEIRCRSDRESSGYDARHFLNLVKAHFHDPGPDGFVQLASGLGLGLQQHGPVVDLTRTHGDRRISVAQIDVTLHAYIDVEMPAYGYVETIEVETKWRGPDDQELQAGLQFTGEIP